MFFFVSSNFHIRNMSFFLKKLFITWLQDWLDKNADYEAIVDGANVGLYQQNYADGGFSVSQVVTLMYLFHFVLLCFGNVYIA